MSCFDGMLWGKVLRSYVDRRMAALEQTLEQKIAEMVDARVDQLKDRTDENEAQSTEN